MKNSVNTIVKELHNDYKILSSDEKFLAELDFPDATKLKLSVHDEIKDDCSNISVIYIGQVSDPKIIAWSMQNQPNELIVINAQDGKISRNPIDVGRRLMQRFYLIEKAKGL